MTDRADMTSATRAAEARPLPRAHHPAVLVTAVVLAIVVGVGTAWWSGSLSADASAHTAQARWAQLVGVVHEANTALLDEVNVLAAAALEDPAAPTPSGDDVTRTAHVRSEAVRALRGRMDVLATDMTVGRAVQQLREVYADIHTDPTRHVELADVFGAVDQADVILAGAARSHTTAIALVQLASQLSIPRLVLNDLLDVTYLQQGEEVAPWAREYFSTSEAYLLVGGGWLEDPSSGMLTSEYIPSDVVRTHLPSEWTDLRALMDTADANPLLRTDAWVQGWPDTAADAPPVAVADVAAAVAGVTGPADAMVIATVEHTARTERAAATRATQQRVLVVVVGLLLIAVTAVMVIRAGQRHWGRVSAWRAAALTDPLTGLANRRALQAWASTPMRDGSVLLLFDLDDFKGINDAHGHATGDRALVAVADCVRSLSESLPDPTIAARIGGDEFVLYAHGVADPAATAEQLAAALVDAITTTDVVSGGRLVPLSISIGIATDAGVPPMEALLLEADTALYEVKRRGGGRDRRLDVTTADPGTDHEPQTGLTTGGTLVTPGQGPPALPPHLP